MQWIKGVGSAVSYLSKGGSNCPYTLTGDGKKLDGPVPWLLFSSKKKDSTQDVSVFVYEVTASSDPLEVTAAKNCLKRLRTLRHPQILSYIDGGEPEKVGKVWIVTESVTPLKEELIGTPASSNEVIISWGLYSVLKAVAFLSNDCKLVHGVIGVPSIFVNKSGDWKLGMMDLLSDMADPDCCLRVCEKLRIVRLLPPEMARGGQWPLLQAQPVHSIDSWSLGVFIHEIFNGQLFSQDDLRSAGKMPPTLSQTFRSFLNSNPTKRTNAVAALESPFCSTELVRVNCFLEEIALKDVQAKEEFCKRLYDVMEQLPDAMCRNKLLPELVKVLEFGGIASAVLGPLLKIGKKLNADDFSNEIVPSVVRCFASQDRHMRVGLLQNIETFAAHLTPNLIEKDIFPHVCSGFSDTAPVMRELTVKSMIHFAPKLTEKTISATLLRHFATLQTDPEPSIRTNTTICLGKIAPSLPDTLKKKILISAFTRCLKDPFPPSRSCSIMALTATMHFHDPPEIANVLIPAVSPSLLDLDLDVRKHAALCIQSACARIEKYWDEEFKDDFKDASGGVSTSASSVTSSVGAGMMGWAGSALKSSLGVVLDVPRDSNPPHSSGPSVAKSGGGIGAAPSGGGGAPAGKSRSETVVAAPAKDSHKVPEASSESWGESDQWDPFTSTQEKSKSSASASASAEASSDWDPFESKPAAKVGLAGGAPRPSKLGATIKKEPLSQPAQTKTPSTQPKSVPAPAPIPNKTGACDDLLDLLNDDWGSSPSPAPAPAAKQPVTGGAAVNAIQPAPKANTSVAKKPMKLGATPSTAKRLSPHVHFDHSLSLTASANADWDSW